MIREYHVKVKSDRKYTNVIHLLMEAIKELYNIDHKEHGENTENKKIENARNIPNKIRLVDFPKKYRIKIQDKYRPICCESFLRDHLAFPEVQKLCGATQNKINSKTFTSEFDALAFIKYAAGLSDIYNFKFKLFIQQNPEMFET